MRGEGAFPVSAGFLLESYNAYGRWSINLKKMLLPGRSDNLKLILLVCYSSGQF